MIAMRSSSLLVLLTVMVAPVAALAQQSSGDRLAAETLFNEGRALLLQRKYDDACPKFAASQRLDPAVGTLLNLADCYERKGQLASAWLQFREAASLAASRNDERRLQGAREKSAALEPKLARLTIRASADIEVTRDGARVDRALFGTPVPVDAGSHMVEARASGKKPWRTTLQTVDASTLTVDVPELAQDDTAKPVVVGPRPADGADQPSLRRDAGGAQRIAGLTIGGAGLIGIGLGTVFALDASSKWSSVTAKCPDRVCPDNAARDDVGSTKDAASRSATFGTIGLVAGGALLVGGAVLFFTAPKGSSEQAVRLAPMVGREVAGITVMRALP